MRRSATVFMDSADGGPGGTDQWDGGRGMRTHNDYFAESESPKPVLKLLLHLPYGAVAPAKVCCGGGTGIADANG